MDHHGACQIPVDYDETQSAFGWFGFSLNDRIAPRVCESETTNGLLEDGIAVRCETTPDQEQSRRLKMAESFLDGAIKALRHQGVSCRTPGAVACVRGTGQGLVTLYTYPSLEGPTQAFTFVLDPDEPARLIEIYQATTPAFQAFASSAFQDMFVIHMSAVHAYRLASREIVFRRGAQFPAIHRDYDADPRRRLIERPPFVRSSDGMSLADLYEGADDPLARYRVGST